MKKNSRKTYQHVRHRGHEPAEHHRPSHPRVENIYAILHEEPRSFWKRLSDNLAFTKYLLLVLFIPPILNFGALQREAIALFPKGQKVDMGWGQKMFIRCEGIGLPTVILDAPTGTNSDIWLFVHEELAKITQVCVYDRSGIGNSDPAFSEVSSNKEMLYDRRFVAQPATLSQMTSDLHHLLKEAHPLPHPFILVGAEVGALVARMYSLLYTEDVSGIVLVDPLVETLFLDNSEWRDYWFTKLLPSYESLHLSAAVGVSRIALLLGLLNPMFFKEHVPDDVMHRQKSLLCNPRHINSAFHEYLFMNTSFLQMSETWLMKPFPKSISVSVISRERPAEFPSNLFALWNNSLTHLVNNLHQNCHNDIISEADFLKLYSDSTPIISEVRRIVSHWRDKYGRLPLVAQ